MIEEIPEEKEEIPKREILRKEHVRSKHVEVKVTQHEEQSKTCVTEDVIKVGKLDVTHLEKDTVEAKTVQEIIKTFRDKVDGARKVLNLFVTKHGDIRLKTWRCLVSLTFTSVRRNWLILGCNYLKLPRYYKFYLQA